MLEDGKVSSWHIFNQTGKVDIDILHTSLAEYHLNAMKLISDQCICVRNFMHLELVDNKLSRTRKTIFVIDM